MPASADAGQRPQTFRKLLEPDAMRGRRSTPFSRKIRSFLDPEGHVATVLVAPPPVAGHAPEEGDRPVETARRGAPEARYDHPVVFDLRVHLSGAGLQ